MIKMAEKKASKKKATKKKAAEKKEEPKVEEKKPSIPMDKIVDLYIEMVEKVYGGDAKLSETVVCNFLKAKLNTVK